MADQGEQTVTFDPAQQHLGQVYARALLGATEKAGNSEAVLEEFDSLVHDVLDRLPQLDATLASPRISHEHKERLLDRVFGGKMSRPLLNFLKVVSRHGRFAGLRAIHRQARQQYNKLRGRVEVQVRTALPLDHQLQQAVVQRLQQALGRPVELQTRVDPELLGGIVVRVGDTVYDGSLANSLVRLRQETVRGATRQIQQTLERYLLAE